MSHPPTTEPGVELNPLHAGVEQNPKAVAIDDKRSIIREVLGQREVPMYRKEHPFDPTFLKCDSKIVKYDLRAMGIWRALLSFSHTILSDSNTWMHLGFLTVLCFITMTIVIITDSEESISNNTNVVDRIQLLISFVLAGYISIVISRWDRIRNTTLANLWGALENLNFVALKVVTQHDRANRSNVPAGMTPDTVTDHATANFNSTALKEESDFLLGELARYSQLCLRLTFMAVQNNDNLAVLLIDDTEEEAKVAEVARRQYKHSPEEGSSNDKHNSSTKSNRALSTKLNDLRFGTAHAVSPKNESNANSNCVADGCDKSLLDQVTLQQRKNLRDRLITKQEKQWLHAASIGTRPLMVTAWIAEYFEELGRRGYPLTPLLQTVVTVNCTMVRGGIGATLGAIGTQLPYPYVHLVYWTVQILLATIAIQTGVDLAVLWYTKINGDGMYTPSDDMTAWPEHPDLFFANIFLQYTASNMIYALFVEGILNVMDKLSTPMSLEDTSFSERVYGAVMFNNIRAMRAGMLNYTLLGHPPPMGKVQYNNKGIDELGDSNFTKPSKGQHAASNNLEDDPHQAPSVGIFM